MNNRYNKYILKFVLKTPKDCIKMYKVLERLGSSLSRVSFIITVVAPKKIEYLDQILSAVNRIKIKKLVRLFGVKELDTQFFEIIETNIPYGAS